MKTKILFLGLVLSLFTVSCSKDNQSSSDQGITTTDAATHAKMDQVSSDVEDVVESQYFAQNTTATGKSSAARTGAGRNTGRYF